MGAAKEPGPSMRGGSSISEHVVDFPDCIRTRHEPAASAEVAHLTCGLVHRGEVPIAWNACCTSILRPNVFCMTKRPIAC